MTTTAGQPEQLPDPGLSSVELVNGSGASFRRVDYWIRTGLLAPMGATCPGQGYSRRFAPDQLDRAKAIVALSAAGIGFEAIREHIDHLIQHGGYQAGPVTVTYTPDLT